MWITYLNILCQSENMNAAPTKGKIKNVRHLQEFTILWLKIYTHIHVLYTNIYVNCKHKAKWICCELNICGLPNSYVKALTPSMAVITLRK